MSRKLHYPKRKGICLDAWLAADKLLYAGKYVCAVNVVKYLGVDPKRYQQTISVELAAWKKFHGLDNIGKYPS